MDVAKYIGLFLIKNNFVYIHGLGNLELKKKASKHDGQSLTAPTYEVMMTTMGSIDDNLANFIATNEQISISKASNALREFSMQARSDMHTGKAVEIPAVGKFVEERGKTVFITDPNFTHTPPPIPTMRFAKREETFAKPVVSNLNTSTPYSAPNDTLSSDGPPYPVEEESSISWGKIAIWVAVLAVLGALAYFGVRYMNSNDSTTESPLIVNKDSLNTQDQNNNVAPENTTANNPANSATGIVDNNGLLSFDVVLNTYDGMDKAIRRTEKLKSYGNSVEMKVAPDSSAFYVVLSVNNVAAADTTMLLDSLRRNFNPNGVNVLR